MSGGKEIRTQIKSVKNTQKITKAMEMVAASKMRKAQDQMASSRPYAEKIRDAISHVAQANSEYKHPYMVSRKVKRVAFIVISSERGLCGSLNTTLFRQVVKKMKELDDKNIELDLALIGKKALQFFKSMGGNVVAQASDLGDKPSVQQLVGSVKTVLDAYDANEIDEIYIAYNKFINTMNQDPRVSPMLPITAIESDIDNDGRKQWDYLYEPDARELLNTLLVRFIESQVYQAVVENLASEQAARMVAMKAASDNANTFIGDLQLAYNKARQAAITQELSEIVGGAAAV